MLEFYSSFADTLIQFGGGLGLLMGLGRYPALKEKNLRTFFVSILFISIGIVQCILSGFFYGWIFRFPTWIVLLPISIAMYGPIEHFYTNSLLKEKFDFGWKESLHLIPLILIFLFEIPFLLKTEDEKINIVQEVWFQNRLDPINLLLYFSALCATGYNLFLFWIYFRNSKSAPILPAFRIGIFLIPFRLIATLFLIYGHFSLNFTLLRTGAVLISILLIQLYIFSVGNPESLALLIQEVRKNRYERSLLIGVDMEAVQKKLNEFMEVHQLYKREDLSLKELADSLSLTGHQLSEFLNEKIRMNFPSFINQYRITEAQKILLKEPKRTILSIAYEVGFNSKSSFNQAFLRFTGITPKEFRKKRSGL
ncbi:AraC family transcriptional regulator [Leptospira sp. 201903070]|uniref:AraC family transcriptional regulator n=1 Tax=Leptospira ainlahdjerensis TaxID=2810033 RepID=A0ABS2U944_9LEPT|nr:helix-turn-helix domain-containing protein [Leptospira ainlahdjerensis]MBM9576891.1 AraC family transcriptional regulator [Leptospira ainlahdjerensis]